MPVTILPKSALGKLSFGLIAVSILLFISVPILEYQVKIDFGSKPAVRILMAAALVVSSLGAILTGFICLKKQQGAIFILPLVLGLFILLISLGMMFNAGA